MQQMFEDYENQGLIVLSPGYHETQAACLAWVNMFNLTYEVLSDVSGVTSQLFIPVQGGYLYFPHNSIIDQNQILRYSVTGFNHTAVENMVLSLFEPEGSLDPTTLNFGTVPHGQNVELEVTIDNIGTGALQVTDIYSSYPAMFSIDPTSGEVFAFDDELVITVIFHAAQSGSISEVLTVVTDAGNLTADLIAQVTGSGPFLWVEPTSVDFGEVEVGSSEDETFWAYNIGEDPVSVTSIAIAHPDFTVTPTTANIPGGDSAEVTLTYTPTGMDTLTGLILGFESNGGNRDIEVGALGIQAIIASSWTSVDFGTVQVGGFQSRDLRVRNDGNGLLTISNVDLVVNIQNMTYNLESEEIEPGDSTICYLTWIPTSVGILDGSITFESNGGDLEVVLIGESQTLGVIEDELAMPTSFSLDQNYPNPFNASTMIPYAVPQTADISIAIYNIYGRTIQSIDLGETSPGWHQAYWNGSDARGIPVGTGIYFYRLLVDGRSMDLRKMVYLK